METFSEYLFYWVTDLSLNLLLYFGLGGFAFFFFWKLCVYFFQSKRIQSKQRADREQIQLEIKRSVFSLFIFATMDSCLYFAEKFGYTRIYENIEDYGYGYFFGSIFLMLIIHDTYYYWTHWLMHKKPVYKHVHKVHHESVDTTPFTAFSFHPLETLVEFGITPIIAFLMPAHLFALLAFQVLMTFFNVIGHMGYEVYPSWWIKIPFLNLKTTSVHHNLHHSKFNGNYGLYFTWWDKWMGTEFPETESKFADISSRPLSKINKELIVQ